MNLARLVATLLFPILAALLLAGCERDDPSQSVSAQGETARSAVTAEVGAMVDGGWRSLADLVTGGRIGVILGTVMSVHAEQNFPHARLTTYNSTTDQIVAVKTGKVDAGIFDSISARAIINAHPELAILDEGFLTYPLGIGFRQDRGELRERFDRYLTRLRASGAYAEIHRRWFSGDPEGVTMPDYPVQAPKEVYLLGVSVADLPYAAFKDGRYIGFDLEILQRFAAEEGITFQIQSLDFGALIPALAAGKVDLITDGLAITPERAKAVDFSTPYGEGQAAAVVLKRRLASPTASQPAAPPPAGGGAVGQPEAGGTSAQDGENHPAMAGSQSLDKLARGRIAVFNGTAQDLFVTKAFPEAEILRFNSQADFVLAVKTGKVDAAITDAVSIRDIARLNPDLAILADDFYDTAIGAAFRKGDESGLRQRLDRFLAAAREDGTLEDIQRRWLSDQPATVVMPAIPQPDTGETFRVGTSYLIGLPYVSQAEGEPIGHDMELLRRFAAREGLRLEILPMEFDALIASLAVGKIDMIMARLSITDERKAKVDFSVPYDYEHSAALVRRDNLAALAATTAEGGGTTGTGKDQGVEGRSAGASSGAGGPLPAGGATPVGGMSGDPRAPRGWRSLDDLARGRIAVFAGAIQDQFVARTYPEAQVIHLTGIADLITSLKTGKVDAGIIIATSAPEILQASPEIGRLGEPILPVSQGAAFRKEDQELRERFERFMAAILADGTHAEMRQRWFEGDPRQARMPQIPLPAEGPILRLGTSVFVGLPYVGMVDGDYVGFDIELARRFAAREGLRLVMEPLEFSALIPALTSGKLDLIASALAITPERQKQVAFSTPYAEVSSVVLALKKNLPATTGAAGEGAGTAPGAAGADQGAGQGAGQGGAPKGFLTELQASFQANFVLEQRWKLIFTGLWVTVLISVASTIFGTLLGALVCWLRMSPQPLLRWFGSSYIFLIRGLPVLLLLMLIFYVAFAAVNIDPLLVAVIAFGMNFGAYVSEMFRTGIEGVDRGQTEAGIAMGFTRVQTFVHIVLPQAARRILPVYRGEFISLVKMTSIVGYIGVQDLTKAGDIIRSRTFEAFFPLIMVAAIYFLVIWVLGLVLDHLDRRTDPKRRVKAGMHSA